MTLRSWSAALAVAFMLAGAGIVQAQTGRAHVGAHVTYNFDSEKPAIGGQLGLPLARYLDFYPSFDIFFVDNGSLLGFNADLKFRPAPAEAGPLYLGGGLNLSRRSLNDRSNTDAGVNLLAGLETHSGAVHPYVEFRAILADRSTVQLAGGLNFTLGGPRAVVR